VDQAWDGVNLRFTFRRTVDSRLMRQWEELLQIAESLSLKEHEEDAIIWQFESSGKYLVHSLYGVVNNRGVKQVFTPVVWKIIVPPRLHIFLWLLTNNKTLTRDNLAKRRHVEDLTCLFCSEYEFVHHIFFECCVATAPWSIVSEIMQVSVGADFESVAKLWLREKKYKDINTCTSAVLWTLWKARNELCFQGVT
jgi:hypothetical protein